MKTIETPQGVKGLVEATLVPKDYQTILHPHCVPILIVCFTINGERQCRYVDLESGIVQTLEDRVDEWHNPPDTDPNRDLSLPSYLGMSNDQYASWVQTNEVPFDG